jgi:hypothetical protein
MRRIILLMTVAALVVVSTEGKKVQKDEKGKIVWAAADK